MAGPHEFTEETLEPTSRFVEANGISLHGLTWGDPDNPLLIMTHGIGLCAMVWRPLAEDLARDYYVFSLDLRGHGDSDKPGGYTFNHMAEDVIGLVNSLNPPQPPYGIGHSAGGMTIMIANSKAPGTVGPTVLVDTRVGPALEVTSPEEREERMNRTRNKRAIWESREIMYDAYRNRRVFSTWTDDAVRDYIYGGTTLLEDGRAQLKCPTDVEAIYYEARHALNPTPYLKGLAGDYLLLLGNTGNYPDEAARESDEIKYFLDEVQGARMETLPRGSHFVAMESPDIVLASSRRYLDGHRLGGN